MSQGIKTVIYPVTDLARAKATFQKFLGVEPYADQRYYVGFRVGDLDIGLDPNGHKAGMTAYYDVDDIKQSLQSLLDAGAQIEQEIKDIGGGGPIALFGGEFERRLRRVLHRRARTAGGRDGVASDRDESIKFHTGRSLCSLRVEP